MSETGRLRGQLFERGGSLPLRQLVLNVRPTLLDTVQPLLIGGIQRPDTLAEGAKQQTSDNLVHLSFS
ncbi:hypothetical protein D3C85_1478790 [compost metagenome]